MREDEHADNSRLKVLVTTVVLVKPTHPLFTMTQVERLFLVHFDESTLPWAKGCALVDIPEQGIACTIIEGIGYDELYPTVQGDIKGIRILKITRVALKDQSFCVHTKVAQQAVGDMCMPQFVLDDRDS